MTDAPDTTALLVAIARFLSDDVVRALPDPALAFRVRIAAHTLGGLAREVTSEARMDQAELAALTGGEPPRVDPASRQAEIRDARAALVARIRDPATPAHELAQLRRVHLQLEGARAVLGQPRFDLSDRIEP